MLVNRTEYATGLGDLASTLKARSKANLPTNAPGIAQTLAPGWSNTLKVQAAQNKVLSLIGQTNALTKYKSDVAAGNINPAFAPPPAAVDSSTLAAARQAFANATQKFGTIDQKAAPSLSLFSKAKPSLMVAAATAVPVAAAAPLPAMISPAVQQAASTVLATNPALLPTSAVDTSGGGGGGGGGDDSTTPDTTDTTLPDATGWAALSGGTQIAIVAGGLVVVGGIYYLIRHH